jgi:hypothetical protein
VREFRIEEDKKLDHITVRIDDEIYTWDEIRVDNRWIVQVKNYQRAGTASSWNLFRGDIEFRKETY